MIRVVRTPDGRIELDATGRSAGRGAYVCRDATCLERATGKGALGRALATRIPAEVQTALAASLATITESTPPITLNTTEGGARGQE